jgi:hypothetical protein
MGEDNRVACITFEDTGICFNSLDFPNSLEPEYENKK